MDDQDVSTQDIKLLQPIRSIFFDQVTLKQEQPKNINKIYYAIWIYFFILLTFLLSFNQMYISKLMWNIFII